jgi:hypothetical protein
VDLAAQIGQADGAREVNRLVGKGNHQIPQLDRSREMYFFFSSGIAPAVEVGSRTLTRQRPLRRMLDALPQSLLRQVDDGGKPATP